MSQESLSARVFHTHDCGLICSFNCGGGSSCWQDSIPWGLLDWEPQLQLAGGHPQLLAMWAFSTSYLTSSKCASQEGNKENLLSRLNITVVYNQVTEVTSHHFFYTPIFRNNLLCPAHIQREGITQDCEYQEVGIIEGDLKGCLLQQITKFL